MHFGLLLLVCFFGPGFSAVQVKQYFQKKYQVGDSAILYCNLTSEKETVRSCTMMWQIYDENAKTHVRITKIPKYHQRVNIKSQDTFTSMTIEDLMVTDTENILCSAVCLVNEKIQFITDNGTVLTVTEPEREPKSALQWLKYLIFSINLLIFTIALGIFLFIVRKRRGERRR